MSLVALTYCASKAFSKAIIDGRPDERVEFVSLEKPLSQFEGHDRDQHNVRRRNKRETYTCKIVTNLGTNLDDQLSTYYKTTYLSRTLLCRCLEVLTDVYRHLGHVRTPSLSLTKKRIMCPA